MIISAYLKYRWYDRYDNGEMRILEESGGDTEVLLSNAEKIVSHNEYQKQKLVKDSKYFKFLFFQIFGSIFPALTILFKNRVNSSSNLDTCYLNYLCTQDMFVFFSFNTMSSSISMAVIGLLNLIIVLRKQIFRYEVPRLPSTHGIQKRDAPKVVFCLALIAEGIPRMIVNNCQDNSMDAFYNYASAWVNYSVIFWIYSKRHGVRKWQQFYMIAVSLILGCFTQAESEIKSGHLGLKILFCFFGIGSTGFFCYQYYYERPSGLGEHQWIPRPFDKSPKNLRDENGIYRPLKSKIVFIVISLTISGLCSSAPIFIPSLRVSSIINIYIQSQLFFYWLFYYIQKIRFERQSFTLLYTSITLFLTISILVLTVVNRYLGAYYNTYKTTKSPAESREFNRECVLPGIDWNHIRQYNGAVIWFMFLLLMDYIDSNIRGVNKKFIFVF
uniref:AcidPPc domain-containing protein n=1 Tax=Caenorhabditis tropicalis TaxID=1561998 RepID=A0A1I7UXJ6_9PELO